MILKVLRQMQQQETQVQAVHLELWYCHLFPVDIIQVCKCSSSITIYSLSTGIDCKLSRYLKFTDLVIPTVKCWHWNHNLISFEGIHSYEGFIEAWWKRLQQRNVWNNSLVCPQEGWRREFTSQCSQMPRLKSSKKWHILVRLVPVYQCLHPTEMLIASQL